MRPPPPLPTSTRHTALEVMSNTTAEMIPVIPTPYIYGAALQGKDNYNPTDFTQYGTDMTSNYQSPVQFQQQQQHQPPHQHQHQQQSPVQVHQSPLSPPQQQQQYLQQQQYEPPYEQSLPQHHQQQQQQHHQQQQHIRHPPQPENERCTVKVTKIPTDITEPALRQYFETFGQIVAFQLTPTSTHPSGGNNNHHEKHHKYTYNECIIQYYNTETAKKCLYNPNAVLGNRFIQTKPAYYNLIPINEVIINNKEIIPSVDDIQNDTNNSYSSNNITGKRKSYTTSNIDINNNNNNEISNKYTCYEHTESTISNNNIIKNEKIKEKNQEKIQEKIHEKKEIQEKFEHLKTLRQQAEEIIKKKEKILMVIKYYYY